MSEQINPCRQCGAVHEVKATPQYSGGDSYQIFRISCTAMPGIAFFAQTLGPHGYPQDRDPFKTNDEARAALVRIWNKANP